MMRIDKIMPGSLQLIVRWLCNTNGKFFITLPGISRNNGRIEVLRQPDGDACFSNSRGAGNDYTSLFINW